MSTRHFACFAFAAAIATLVVSAAISAQAQINVLYNAPGDPGPNNMAGMVLARDGNFYGGARAGGTNNVGLIYQLTTGGTETNVYNVASTDPQCFYIPQILATNGNIYGKGQNCSNGVLFAVTTSGTFTILHTFSGTDGSGPDLAFQGPNGQLYGFTASGGANSGGTFFEITTSGTLTTLYSFTHDISSPVWQPTGILLGKDNNYYGVGYYSQTGTEGAVFKLTPSGKLTVLHSFTSTPDGANPVGLVQGTDENLYGVTQNGGSASEGSIYKISPSGKNYNILHNAWQPGDGAAYPSSELVEGSDGNFYSTMPNCNPYGSCGPGNVFEITPAGTYTTLGIFDTTNGNTPYTTLIQDPNGTFYGTAFAGGQYGNGTFYSVSNGLGAFAKLLGSSGKEASVVGIIGSGFTASSVVKFGGVQATKITRSGSTFINATVPAGALTGIVTVTTGTTTLSSWQTFDVIPTFKTFSPTSGPVGTPVTLTGTGLTQTTKVTFNGKSASFTVNSDTQVTATVPTGATSGKIDITTLGGGAISTSVFTVN